jgi:hypothetical protein
MKMRKLALVMALLASTSVLAAEQWTEEEAVAGLKKSEYTRHALSGSTVLLQFLIAINPDCSVVDGYQFSITKEPEHGTVEIVPHAGFTTFAKDNPRSRCNEKKHQGQMITYKSKDGYVGEDSFTFVDMAPSGFAREITYRMNVRPAKSRSAESIQMPRPRP